MLHHVYCFIERTKTMFNISIECVVWLLSRIFHTLEVGLISETMASIFLRHHLEETPSTYLSTFSSLTIGLGFSNLASCGLLQWLNFRQHFFLQLAAALFLHLTLGMEICTRISETHMMGSIQSLVDVLDVIAKVVLGAMYVPTTESSIPWNVETPCLQLALFVQVFLGFGIVSYVVWLFERHSRVGFLESVRGPANSTITVRRLPVYIMVLHWMFVVTAFAISWEVFSSIGILVFRSEELAN